VLTTAYNPSPDRKENRVLRGPVAAPHKDLGIEIHHILRIRSRHAPAMIRPKLTFMAPPEDSAFLPIWTLERGCVEGTRELERSGPKNHAATGLVWSSRRWLRAEIQTYRSRESPLSLPGVRSDTSLLLWALKGGIPPQRTVQQHASLVVVLVRRAPSAAR
jgi:hypothetical protein